MELISWIKNLEFVTVLGFAAGLLTAVSMLPQLVKTWQSKKVEDVSPAMLIVLMSGICLWIWYGIKKQDYPIMITNLISLVINICLTVLRYRYRNKN